MKKTVVVTGGSRGLGFGIAKALVQDGFEVIAISRSGSDTSDWISLRWDLADIAQLGALASHIREQYGTIYGLINNAGIGLSGILSTTPDAKIEDTIRVNVTSPVVLTKYLVRSMMSARAGRIINLSSIVASTGYPGLSVYSTTKASMIGFTRSLAREVGPLGITVNAIAPGFLDTEMTHALNPKQRDQIRRRSALQRMATIDDVSAVVAFLLSEKAANITGTVTTVDAGNTA